MLYLVGPPFEEAITVLMLQATIIEVIVICTVYMTKLKRYVIFLFSDASLVRFQIICKLVPFSFVLKCAVTFPCLLFKNCPHRSTLISRGAVSSVYQILGWQIFHGLGQGFGFQECVHSTFACVEVTLFDLIALLPRPKLCMQGATVPFLSLGFTSEGASCFSNLRHRNFISSCVYLAELVFPVRIVKSLD